MKRALISVSDKMGLSAFAKGLVGCGVEIYSTGGTRSYLMAEGIAVREVAEYTGFPEMMEGRLKTLHPKIHGGILCRRDNISDMNAMTEHNIHPFELVVVNLYPFAATIAQENVTDAQAIAQIDVGGPTMVRAAAKNHQFVTIVTSSAQYAAVLEQIQETGCTTFALRRMLAQEAFTHTADYDTAISRYFIEKSGEGDFPTRLTLAYKRNSVLRYGENPHQLAALYVDAKSNSFGGIVGARQLHGKELSYNNLLDLDAALAIVRSFTLPAVSVIKHNNPCGAAIAETLAAATAKAMEGDPLSAFGSVLAMNCAVDAAVAEYLSTPGLFVEAIAAPEFTAEALAILTTKPKWKTNVRLLQTGKFSPPQRWMVRPLDGGALLQEADVRDDDEALWQTVTQKKVLPAMMNDLRFAWQMVRFVKSNAITICKDGALLGAGAGQMSRVDATEIAIKKAGARIAGAVLASDAFFPFPDSVEKAASAGIAAIIQPGGSKNDDAVIEFCDAQQIPMIFTGVRHFKH